MKAYKKWNRKGKEVTPIENLKVGKIVRIVGTLMYVLNSTLEYTSGCRKCNNGKLKINKTKLGSGITAGKGFGFCRRHGRFTYTCKIRIAMDLWVEDGTKGILILCKNKAVGSLFKVARQDYSDFLEEPCTCKYGKLIRAILGKQIEILGKVTKNPKSDLKLSAMKIKEIKHV